MMASTRRAAKQVLPRKPSLISSSLSPLMADNASGSISMDDLLKNIYSDTNPPSLPAVDSPSPMFHAAGDKGMDEVWKEIVAGDGVGAAVQQQPADGGMGPQMTLEDFLTKAAEKPPVEVVAAAAGTVVGAPLMMMNGGLIQPQSQLGFVSGRGKRRAAVQEEPLVDKATLQKQRRMIKNRESAARSREKKQAYTVDLESMVARLEEENARLLREEALRNEENCQKLVKVVIPVIVDRRPPRTLCRVHSM
ncbi:hypothetical protein SAY87_020703 [Trapa incisa]|uniref:BZIP domain-containing protein n=2 Tax=Trapa TaxID=22665 RepID=A0AAN7RI77_TRANT|nr:hypothetical protein SAY87_020703 [Trapa incisa]KAK4804932.1 hypothetical protein SAY86_004749 [Trapa natans]